MISYSRLAWVASLWSVWWASDASELTLAAAVGILVFLLGVRPRATDVGVIFLLSLLFAVQILLLHFIAGLFGAGLEGAAHLSAVAGVRVVIMLLGYPLFARGTLLDDVLLAVAQLPRFSISGAKLIPSRAPGGLVIGVAFLGLPVLTVPRQLRSIRRAQVLRGIMPVRLRDQFHLLWRRPAFFIWDLHIEPIVVRNILAIPVIFDALAIKGYQLTSEAKWRMPSVSLMTIVYLIGVAANVYSVF